MLTPFLLAICTAEMIVGGPGFWAVGGVPVRRAIFVVVTGWLVGIALLGRIRLGAGHVLLLATLAVLFVVWVFAIPLVYQPNRLDLAIQEGLPLGFVVLGALAHAYLSDNPEHWRVIRAVAGYSLAAVAVVSIVLWVIGTSLGDAWPLVTFAANAFFAAGNADAELPLYVHQMPDGFFRVMWITSLLFVPALLTCWARRNLAGVILFSIALLTSYTRAFWGVAVLGLLAAHLLSRRAGSAPLMRARYVAIGAAIVVAAGLGAAVSDVVDLESVWRTVGDRVGTTLSDESAEDRVDQFGPLVAGWETAPVLGRGFGSVASVVRSEQAPYLYELTYVALLMKLGAFGLIAFLAVPAALLARPFLRSATPLTAAQAASWASILSILVASATNPYLLNLVGLGALSYFFIDLDLSAEPSSIVAQPMPGVTP